uniref:Large ribosomal subunit protein bL33c n=1 Tax=Nitzschia sp. NIES-3576 TaxID=2083273 RepID=A0A2Z5ZB98_9STRA|nr:ribosomal protein L33 [Nitzschia sp. NIES-3576]
MEKKKKARILVTLECKECNSESIKRSKGISRYITKKNKQNTPEQLILKKYCKFCNKITVHKEIK